MKKILFSAYNLDIGGIETSLITLINFLLAKGYEISLVLEKKEGFFLDKISPNVQIIEYTPANDKNIFIRKFKNLIKKIKFIFKYRNKFDFSASFATYSIPGSFVARTCAKNNALWGHADYLTVYDDNANEMKHFFKKLKCNKFKHIIFVSEEGKNSFIKIFPKLKNKIMVCNNLINDKRIINKSEEDVYDLKKKNVITFLNVGRHDEKQKKLSRIIEASEKLKNDEKKFRVVFIGEGKDTLSYKEMVERLGLRDNIIFLGKKENPYPYFNLSDAIILSSDYEGYPMVYLEAFVLNKPIITTKVSDYQELEGKGITVDKNTDAIYNAMKEFIEDGYKITKKFDAKKYNEEIIEKLEKIF